MSKSKKSASSAARALRLLVIVLALACAAVGGVLIFGPRESASAVTLEPSGTRSPDAAAVFADGVRIQGVSVAGMTVSEAREALSSAEQSIIAQAQFVLQNDGVSATLTSADMTFAFDVDGALKEALSLTAETAKDVPLSYTADVAGARAKVEAFAQSIHKDPVDAAAAFKTDFTAKADLQAEDCFDFVEGTKGQSLDVDALMALLAEKAAAHEYEDVELPILYTDPAVTADALRAKLVKRSSAVTSFKKSPYNRADRVFNVKKAASLVNGTVLKPGDVFSMNDTLGPRTEKLGWKLAPAYVQGTTEDQAGGGVCQVSTTTYAAAVQADLTIVYRRNHSSPVHYTDMGLDATINTGSIDFKFKNSTDSNLYIVAYAVDSKDGKVPEGLTDKTVHVEIFGDPLPDAYDKITMTSEKTETLEPSGEIEYIVDTTVAPDYYKEDVKRTTGSVWQSYKHYWKDGAEVKSEPLAKSTYKAYAGHITVGINYQNTLIPTITPPPAA